MADTILPYTVKVSDGKQDCTRCNKKIKKDELQLGRMMQSPTEDKIVPQWFDIDCFFKAVRPAFDHQFNNFANLNNTEKRKLRNRIDIEKNGKKGVKRAAENFSPGPTAPSPSINNFAVQYSRLGQNMCSCCFKKIPKGKMEMKKSGAGLAGTTVWYHLDCFKRHSSELGWRGEPDDVPGFQKLKRDDQQLLKKKMESKDGNNNEPAAKKHKTGSLDDVNAIIEKKVASQTKELHYWKNTLKGRLAQKELIEILEANNQFVPKDNDGILMHIADMMYFGALQPCDKCTSGKFMFENSSYKCMGYTNFAKCNNLVKEPKRSAVKIPQHIKNAHDFLKQKLNVGTRAIKIKLTNADQPLFDMEFSIIGNLVKTKKDIKDIIEKLGGRITTFLNQNKTAAVISRDEEVLKDEKFMNPYMKSAKQLGIQVIPVNFLDAVKAADPFVLIKEMNLSTWDCIDPARRLTRNGAIISKTDSFYDEGPSKMQKWKNGEVAIDAECDLKNAHVYCGAVHHRMKFFTALMTLVDIVLNKNSYHQIQLIESDDEKSYWIFEKHGRISTKIGGKTTTEYDTEDLAVSKFKERFVELTGNEFCDFAYFAKKPEKFQLMDIVQEKQIRVLDNLVESKLNPQVYELIKLICNEKAMEETMLRFEIDTATMPLGKISKNQIKEAQRALQQLSRRLHKKKSESELIEASNRFYTMIPHKFIRKPPPIIKTTEMIASKMELLERLREIEFTYSLLNETNNMGNPLDGLYHKLDAEISPLDRTCDEYGQITRYVQQTQDPNEHHSAIEVLDILEVVRRGEEVRFKPFKNFKNRTLLWHGSCLTNFIGILSTGLKLSPPPDVEINGNAFGNGIYFADSVTKSAMYCNASEKNEALLLLCEVALGEIHEITGFYNDMNSQLTPPKGKHSVKAIGQRSSPSHITRTDGVLMPDGIVIQKHRSNQIQFNEYIVHNEAQIRIRYMVKVKLLGYENYDDEDEDDYDDDGEYDTDILYEDSDSDEIIEISD